MSKKYPANLVPFIQDAKLGFKMQLDRILASEQKINLINALVIRLKEAMPECTISASNHLFRPVISIHLKSGYNVSKHVLMFLEENAELINQITGGTEYSACLDDASGSYDITWSKLCIYVFYGGGSCKLVKTGTETIEKPIYTLECVE